MPTTNLFWPWRVSCSSLGEWPSRTRASSLALSEQLALSRPGAGCSPALVPPAKSIKQKDQYILDLIKNKVLESLDYLLSKACEQALSSPAAGHFLMKPRK